MKLSRENFSFGAITLSVSMTMEAVFVFSALFFAHTAFAQCAETIGGVCIPSGTTLPDGGGGDGASAIINILVSVMQWLLGIFGVLAILAFIISGIMYLTSAGDETRASNARKMMIYAIIGVIVGLAGVLIISAIDFFLDGGSTFF